MGDRTRTALFGRWAHIALAGLWLLARPARADEADAGEPAPEARVSFLEGTATLIMEDAGSPIAEGDDVEEGDRLVTSANGRLEVMFADGTLENPARALQRAFGERVGVPAR